MKSLFNEKEDWTEESRKLDRELGEALKPIIQKWVDLGYSVRDIQLAVHFAAFDAGLNAAISKLHGV